MAISMPLGGWLSDRLQLPLGYRWGRAVVPLGGMIAGAGLLGLGVAAKEPAWIVAWFSLALGAVGACEGSFWSTAVESGGRLGGIAAAIVNTGGNGGGVVGPGLPPLGKKEFSLAGWGWSWGPPGAPGAPVWVLCRPNG